MLLSEHLPYYVLNPHTHLIHHVSDHVLGKEFISVVVAFLHQLVEVLLHVLEHKVQCVVLPDDLTASTALNYLHETKSQVTGSNRSKGGKRSLIEMFHIHLVESRDIYSGHFPSRGL